MDKTVAKKKTFKDFKEEIDTIIINNKDDDIQDDETWAVINSFFEENGLNSTQIHSYNDFIYNKAQAIIDSEGIKKVTIKVDEKEYILEFGDLYFSSPVFTEINEETHLLYPMEALWRNTNYVSEIYCDIGVTPPTDKKTVYEKHYMGDMPVMVGSDLCNRSHIANNPEEIGEHSEDFLDHGGYFIIAPKSDNKQGAVAQRRVLTAQEKNINNRIFIFKNRKNSPKFSTYAECHSTTAGTHTTTTTVGCIQSSSGTATRISCILPWLENVEIPVGVLFRAFGIDDEKMMATYILGPNYKEDKKAIDILLPILEYSYECNSQEAALHFIGRRGRKFTKVNTDDITEDILEEDTKDKQVKEDRETAISYAKHLISSDVLSHILPGPTTTLEENFKEKAIFLGYMIKRLLYVMLGRQQPEDRDHYMNKVVWTTGALLAQQFLSAMKKLITEVSNNVIKALKQGHTVNIKSWIKPNIITNSMIGAISNNSWAVGGDKAKGTSQIYEQYNYTAGISNMKKVRIQIVGDAGKIISVRDVRGPNFGKTCPAETPEGKTSGLVKNLAMMCYISIETDPVPLKRIIHNLIGTDYKDKFPASINWTRIFLNGAPVGFTTAGTAVVNALRKMKREGEISSMTSVSYKPHYNEIHVSTEAGRFCRPLLVIENGEIKMKVDTIEKLVLHSITWTELLTTGMVELVDAAEEEEFIIAGYPSELEKMTPENRIKFTHCELHPSMMYGIGGSIIPFLDHNQCIEENEEVLMANGDKKKIKDIKVGDEVVNFDPKSKVIGKCKVENVIVKLTNKSMYEIETILETKIKATFDHRFITLDGWKEVNKLKVDDYIGIYNSVSLSHPKENLIFVPIKSITMVKNNRIADITTDSPYQSFICNGFGVHNSPRNSYQASMGKQAVGMPFTNYKQMMSGTFQTMRYMQRPFTLSRAASIMGFDEMPAGQNAMVVVMPRKFNEEDSIELNEDSIARGFMVSDKWTCYYAEVRKDREELFGVPTLEECERFRGNASKLNELGFVPKGTKVEKGDILIGKMIKQDTSKGIKKKYADVSVKYDHLWPAVVDMVQVGRTSNGYPYIRIMTVQERVPIVGDKFCYTPNHDVLTDQGWVGINEVKYEHRIATLSKDGHLEYQHPTDIVSFDHGNGGTTNDPEDHALEETDNNKEGEDIVVVNTNQVHLEVTPNHKMYVKRRNGKEYKLEEASTLNNIHVHYKKNAEWYSEKVEYFTLPSYCHKIKSKIIYPPVNLRMDDWLVFFGIWMAEGWTHNGLTSIAINKKRVREALEVVLKELELEYKIASDGLKMHLSDKQLFNYMQHLSVKAINRQLPEWVWELSKEQCIILLESMCLGDGHMNDTTPMYDTSSVKLKDDVMRLALHCGWAANASVRSKKETHKVIWGANSVTNVDTDVWRITIVKKQLEPAVNKHIKNQQTIMKYSGKVYCVTVPNGVIYVRNRLSELNSSEYPVWCGNSARHGQKGTAGKIIKAIDLPFNSQGIAPDIVINSLAFASRMTIAMLIEIWTGKVVSSTSPLYEISVNEMIGGTEDDEDLQDNERWYESNMSPEFSNMFSNPNHPQLVDATPFRKFDRNVIKDEMAKYGMSLGDEYFTDGITGKPLRCLAFFGPCYYQRLRHQVIDKVHARSRGPKQTLSRQPAEGRARDGGLRIGVMERDCIYAHGAAHFGRDRLMEQSDDFSMWMCDICGLPAHVEQEGNIKECKLCGTTKVSKVRIPYGTKLIKQELMALNVVPRVLTVPHSGDKHRPSE